MEMKFDYVGASPKIKAEQFNIPLNKTSLRLASNSHNFFVYSLKKLCKIHITFKLPYLLLSSLLSNHPNLDENCGTRLVEDYEKERNQLQI
jgi:hypothetical protein